MFELKAHLPPRSAIQTELVHDHHARRRDGGFQELLHEPLRSARVSSTLDQDVENEAILIDGAPQPVRLAGDRDHDFVHMPFVAASGRAPTDLIGERLAELLPPLTHGFVGHANSARREHLLDHAEAQGKPEIEPYGVADDLRVEPLRRRQSKGAATDMPGLKPPRDTPTLRRLRLEARPAYLPT